MSMTPRKQDVSAPSMPTGGVEQDDSGLSRLMSRLGIRPGTPASPGVVEQKTSRYSVIDVVMSYQDKQIEETITEIAHDVVHKETTIEKEDVVVVITETTTQTTEKDPTKGVAETTVTPKRIPATLNKPQQNFAERFRKAKNVIIMVGAGLSVAAGIPDFRTPGTGLYSQLAKYNLPARKFKIYFFKTENDYMGLTTAIMTLGLCKAESVFEINYFKKNPEPFRQLASELWPGRKYLPTIGHYFIKLVHDKGKLLRCYTQNIDSLEGMTGLPKDKIVAAHGNFDSASCVLTGRKVTDMDEVRDAYLNNTMDELNRKHGTRLVKPDIVFFGEALPERFGRLVPKDFAACDLLIVMGTSLQVYPFASLVTMPKKGTPRLLINRERVGDFPRGFIFDSPYSLDAFIQGDCDEGCLKLADALGWGDELLDISKPKL